MSTAFTPQPSVWLIEASRDEGKQYDVLLYLVAHSQQCSSVLGFNNTDIGNELCFVQQAVKNGSSEMVRRSEIPFDGLLSSFLPIDWTLCLGRGFLEQSSAYEVCLYLRFS